MRREFLLENGLNFRYPELTHGEDGVYMYEVGLCAPKSVEIKLALYCYREHSGSAETTVSLENYHKKILSYIRISEILLGYYRDGRQDPTTADKLMVFLWFTLYVTASLPRKDAAAVLRQLRQKVGLYAAGNPDFLGIMNERLSIFLAFIVIAVWWFCVTIPLLKNYKQKYYVETTSNKVKESISRLGKTLVTMYRDEKKVFFFLLAFFFYIDGVYTIIDEAVAIGTALGLNQMGLLVILLLTQVVAFAFATLFGKLSEKYSSVQLITVCILGYFAVAIYALFMKELWQFGIMAFVVGMFQGAIQALSRSYFAQIIPANASGEYFGIYDICGKGAAFMGTTLVGITVSITNSVNVAVATLTVLFILGLFFFRIATKEDK